MRSESEMLDLILGTARQDDRIRAVILNGSRANPEAPRDIFQDYDVVYLVTEMAPFTTDPAWVDRFGERIILQLPDLMGEPPSADQYGFAYLIQLADGNRIDLTLFPVEKLAALGSDSQSILLLDKDGSLPPFPPPSSRDYWPKPPTARDFFDCCNEFWWVSPYVAKGLWREELTYAHTLLDGAVRDQLMKMLTWSIGIETGFSVSPGKFGKYLKKYLSRDHYEMLEATYAGASYTAIWDALFVMTRLFRFSASLVAAHFNFPYPEDDDVRVMAHLRHVRALPKVASGIY